MSRTKNSYSESFKKQILEDYFRNGGSKDSCAKRWGIPTTSLRNWLTICKNEEKSVPLHRFLRMSPILVIATTDTVKKLTFLV